MPRKPALDLPEATLRAHEAACARGLHGYLDPESRLFAMSEVGLRAQRRCCGSGCRHCPYDWEAVPAEVVRRKGGVG